MQLSSNPPLEFIYFLSENWIHNLPSIYLLVTSYTG